MWAIRWLNKSESITFYFVNIFSIYKFKNFRSSMYVTISFEVSKIKILYSRTSWIPPDPFIRNIASSRVLIILYSFIYSVRICRLHNWGFWLSYIEYFLKNKIKHL